MKQLEKPIQLTFMGYTSCARHDGRLNYLVMNCGPSLNGAESPGGKKNIKSAKIQTRTRYVA